MKRIGLVIKETQENKPKNAELPKGDGKESNGKQKKPSKKPPKAKNSPKETEQPEITAEETKETENGAD